MENSKEKTEQILLELEKENERKNKIIWIDMWVIMGISITALIGGIFVCRFLIPEGIWQLLSVIVICILFFNSLLLRLKT